MLKLLRHSLVRPVAAVAMMQDVDRVLAEVAKQATAARLDLESVREVLVAQASSPCR